ncbi:MAG: hypothetical protein AAB574_02935 [Patescibacteria group bacterium]
MFTFFPNPFFPDIPRSEKQITSLLKLHPTPFFLIDPALTENRITTLTDFFKKHKYPFQPAYSCKTNYSLLSLPLLHQHHLFAETVSMYEYQLARKSKFSDSQIIVNGPHKQDLPRLLSKPLLLHLDNLTELNQAIIYSQTQSIRANLGIRINTLLQPSHFGFNLENGQARFALSSLLNSNVPVTSLHLHLGSNLYDPNLYTKSVSVIINFIKDIYSNFGLKLKYLDLGGGFPSHGQLPHHLHTLFQPLESYLKPIFLELRKLPYTQTLILEPGRYLVDDAGIFVSKVIHSNIKDRQQQIIVDSTINQLHLTWTRPNIVAAFSSNLTQLKQTTTPTIIYGASCQEIDILYQGNFPRVLPNDLVVFYCCGAYNQNMTPDFIFPKPKTYFIKTPLLPSSILGQ